MLFFAFLRLYACMCWGGLLGLSLHLPAVQIWNRLIIIYYKNLQLKTHIFCPWLLSVQSPSRSPVPRKRLYPLREDKAFSIN